MNKQKIRDRMRAMRAQLTRAEQEAASLAVAKRVLAYEPYQRAKTVMAYAAARGELSVAPVMADVLRSGKRLVLPRCEERGVMTARLVSGLDRLVPGAYGLMEPDADSEIAAPQEIDLILVPGTAFDRAGRRIGQGGGYYDRFLPGTNAVRLGVCHDFALHDHLDTQAHDVQMNAVSAPGALYTVEAARYRYEEKQAASVTGGYDHEPGS